MSGRLGLLFKTDKHIEGSAPRSSAPVSEQGDGELVAAAKRHDERAWAEIYGRHVEQIYAYIYFRIGDRPAAEDLAADVFVRAIQGIQKYEYRGTPLLAWLYRIAHNLTADYRKTAARRASRETSEPPEETEHGIDAIGLLNERTDMMQAIRALTDDQQQVLILRFYSGMSSAQVAQVMNKPETAVKALQARGLRALKRLLSEPKQRAA